MECWLSPSDPSVWPKDNDSFALHILPTWIDILNLVITNATMPKVKYFCKQQRLHYARRAQSPETFQKASGKIPLSVVPTESSTLKIGSKTPEAHIRHQQSADHDLGLPNALDKCQDGDHQSLSQLQNDTMKNLRPSNSEQEALKSTLVFRRPTEEQLSLGETMSWPLCSFSLLRNRSITWYLKDGHIECSPRERLTKSLPAISLMDELVPLDYKLRRRYRNLSHGQDIDCMIGEGTGQPRRSWRNAEDFTADGEPKILLPVTESKYLGASLSVQGLQLKRPEQGLRNWSHVIFLVVLYILIFLIVCRLGFVLATWSYKNVADENTLSRWKRNYLGGN